MVRTLRLLARRFAKTRVVSSINVFGLAIAFAGLLLIAEYIKNELSFDKWNPKISNLYRLTRSYWSLNGDRSMHLGHISSPFAPNLKQSLPEIELIGRIAQYQTTLSREGANRQNFSEKSVYMVDPDVLEMFDIKLVQGNRHNALEKPFTILISIQAAQKLFGKTQVVGQKLILRDEFLVEITGVFQPLPDNSHWHADYLVSFSTLYDKSVYGREYIDNDWESDSFATYFISNVEIDKSRFEKKLDAFVDSKLIEVTPKEYKVPTKWTRLHVQKVSEIHLYSNLDSEFEPNGKMSTIYIVGTVGILILAMATFNFVNISVSIYSLRGKEVGIRKLLGSSKANLVLQFLLEPTLISLLSLAISCLIVFLASGWVKSNIYSPISNALVLDVLPFVGTAALIIGLTAGVYPAALSAVGNSIRVLKGDHLLMGGNLGLRRILTTLQFCFTIVLVILTVHVKEQLEYLNVSDLGYSRSGVLVMPNDYVLNQGSEFESFYNQLKQNSQIENVTRSSRVPTERLIDIMEAAIESEGTLKPTNVRLKYVCVDEHFFDTYQVKLVAGRNFSREIPSDISEGFILNAKAAELLGFVSPDMALNKKISYGEISGRIIGIVEDIRFESLHETVSPTAFFISKRPIYGSISVRIIGDPKQVVEFLREKWSHLATTSPFEYEFLEVKYSTLYKMEEIEYSVLGFFSSIAICLLTLGLVAFSISVTGQKIKEVSIRKIHGAETFDIMLFVIKEPVGLLVVSIIISSGTAWYLVSSWLESFPYRIALQPLVFLGAAVCTVIFSLLVVIIQAWSVIRVNPVKILRYD
ncbi:MAG: ABC transporter permease [Bacteroidetes bacterium]|nr:ABC transporter permease [Bacteroidota bacterium]